MKRLCMLVPVLGLLGVAAACMHEAPAPKPAAPAKAAEIVWIDDDYPKALAAARDSHRPLVVDFWAVWCHYCTAAEGYTFRDPAVASLADRFVWVRINTDDPRNGDLLGKVEIQGLPTYLVLDPGNEAIVGRWLGSGTPQQFRLVLRDAETAYGTAGAAALAADDPRKLFLDANRAAQAKDFAKADLFYGQALEHAKPGWDRRDDAVAGRTDALIAQQKIHDAVVLALSLPDSARGSAASSALDSAASVLDQLPPKAPDTASLIAQVNARMLAIAKDPAAPLAADERSNLWSDLRELRTAAGDAAGAREAQIAELAILDDAAARAPDPETASGFNSARARAMLALGRGPDAITMLLASEKALPALSDPPARLSTVYRKLGRNDEALAALDRAISRAPARLAVGLLDRRADLLTEMKRPLDACAALRDSLARNEKLPVSERDANLAAATRKKLESCSTAAAK